MTTFAAYARRVRDPERTIAERWRALGGCIAGFKPYGYTATWHKLADGRTLATHRHGITHAADLLDALDELEAGRRVWQAAAGRYAARRGREKAAGLRVPRRGDTFPEGIAYCPDPAVHPAGPLPEVLTRIFARHELGRPGCPNCGGTAVTRRLRTCTTCGIVVEKGDGTSG